MELKRKGHYGRITKALKEQGESRRITSCNLKVSDKEGRKEY